MELTLATISWMQEPSIESLIRYVEQGYRDTLHKKLQRFAPLLQIPGIESQSRRASPRPFRGPFQFLLGGGPMGYAMCANIYEHGHEG
jgi:hypothetical protein